MRHYYLNNSAAFCTYLRNRTLKAHMQYAEKYVKLANVLNFVYIVYSLKSSIKFSFAGDVNAFVR